MSFVASLSAESVTAMALLLSSAVLLWAARRRHRQGQSDRPAEPVTGADLRHLASEGAKPDRATHAGTPADSGTLSGYTGDTSESVPQFRPGGG